MSAEEKFWSHVQYEPSGCWTWTAARVSGADKVGGMHWHGERLSARRIAWAITHGAISERTLIARCKNPECMNPSHAYEAMCDDLVAAIVRDRRPGESISALARRHKRPRESLSRYLSAR